MSDKGFLKIIENLENAEYKNSLETMEEIKIGSECVVIQPYHCHSVHLILLDEFIRSNVNGKWKNPYTRNNVHFSEEDHERLKMNLREYIDSLKNIPHELFVRFIKILELIEENQTQMFYFPDVTKIFTLLLSALPLFESLEEAFGNYHSEFDKMVKDMEKNIELCLHALEEECVKTEEIEKFKKIQDFYTIPIDIRNAIEYLFNRLIIILKNLGEKKEEFRQKDLILDIFILLDDIHYCFSKSCDVIIKNQELEEKVYILLCQAEEKVSHLQEEMLIT